MTDAANDLTPLTIVLAALALSYSLNAWFMARLIRSVDAFKREARVRWETMSVSLARIDERHDIEDRERAFDGSERRRGERRKGE